MENVEVKLIKNLSLDEIEPILEESLRFGFSFIQRMKDSWISGKNRFDKRGEVYIGAYIGDRLVGVGGVNIDPYLSDPQIGRIRHLYVLKDFRRKGIAKDILKTLLEHSRSYFSVLRLRSNSVDDSGSSFYEAMGFIKANEESCSHFIKL